MTPSFVLEIGDQDVDFCFWSTEKKKKSNHIIWREREWVKFWYGFPVDSQAIICAFIHAVCQQAVGKQKVLWPETSPGSGATEESKTDESLFTSK